jgi:septum formation protein
VTALTLASKSAARGALLRGAGVAFDTADAGVDEDAVKRALQARGADPKAVAVALAEAKAKAVSVKAPGLVIGADQTLDLAGALFDKVATLEAARARLVLLRGRPHQLHSAIAIARGGGVIWREVVSATLTMRDFSDSFLDAYLAANGEMILSSVGCYQLEGEGVQLFESIHGDYFTILGLPMFCLLDFLRGEGVVVV